MNLLGPFFEVVTMQHLPLRGKIEDRQLEIISNAGIVVNDGKIVEIGDFETLRSKNFEVVETTSQLVVIPGIVDSHTHALYGGSRAGDFAMRNAGKSYLEIAAKGGGIWSSVKHTREESKDELLDKLVDRISKMMSNGTTTLEIKSGYGLDLENEIKMLEIINEAKAKTSATVVSTCLAAHTLPKDFEGNSEQYLSYIVEEILPKVKELNLSERVDIFVEQSAFQIEESRDYLNKAKAMGFELTLHADQFTPGSSRLAVEVGAKSVDHLEATIDEDIDYIAKSDTVAVCLPGASIGLGEPFAPARKLLDSGAIVAIASDYNPGSAPMGNLLTQSSILATYEKLSTAEIFAGITFRAAHALGLDDRGILEVGKKADFVCFPTSSHQNILYRQGELKPSCVIIGGNISYGEL